MRSSLLISAFASVAMLQACASQNGGGSESSPQAQKGATAATGPTKTYTMQYSGTPVLLVTAPADAPCTLDDGSLDLRSGDGYVDIWLVPGARTVQDGVPRVPAQIASEFKGFAATSVSTMTLHQNSGGTSGPGAATRLTGTGREADDNDPGTADVIVFERGGHVFVACTHGESLRESARQLMVRLVQTAAAP